MNDPAFDSYRHALGQTGGHGLAGTGQDATECLPGNPHEARCIELGHSFHVGQAQGLEFIEREHTLLQVAQRDACRFEINDSRKCCDAAGTMRAGHGARLDREDTVRQARCKPTHLKTSL